MTPRWVRVFRALSLLLAPPLAWVDAFRTPHSDALARVVVCLLGPLWAAIAVGLGTRCLFGLRSTAREVRLLDRLDVLTASGSGTLWVSVVAIVGASRLGWPSLSFLGVMGLALVELVVAWTILVAGSDDPVGVASITRRFVPPCVAEGDSAIEEVRLAGARIPSGFRMFMTGSVGPRWATTRHGVDAESAGASGGEVVLESDVGPAHRGDHRAPPLDVWLEDVFGLCQSVRRKAGPAALTVLPRVRAVDGAPIGLDRGGHDLAPRTAHVLPTEGSQRLREYQPGDDARRIHWLRSLTARQVVMRLPDELPPDRPDVLLVLDTFLAPRVPLTCEGHHQLLDALVTVWLGAARALAEAGTRVTLMTAAPKVVADADVAARTVAFSKRAQTAALRLGAEVRWQDDLGVEELLAGSTRPAVVVSYRLQPDPAGARVLRWIVVPRSLWVKGDDALLKPSRWRLPHTIGSPENRLTARRLEAARLRRAWKDDNTLLDLCRDTRDREQRAGQLVATPAARGRVRLEAL
jgi:uncharacterized protein (DUF58 family)